MCCLIRRRAGVTGPVCDLSPGASGVASTSQRDVTEGIAGVRIARKSH